VGVFANTDPFRKHENAGPLAARIVPDREPLTFVVVVFVFNNAAMSLIAHRRAPRSAKWKFPPV
jgi:hypothetical protein